MGAAAGDYDNDGHVDLFVAGVRRTNCSATVATAVRGRDRAGRHRQRRVVGRRRLARLRQRRPARSLRRQLRPVVGRDESLSAAIRRAASASTAIRAFSRGCRTGCIAIAATARSRTSPRERDAEHVGKGMSVAFADYDADGRSTPSSPTTRVPNFLFRNNGDGTFARDRLLAGVARAVTAGRLGAWASTSRTTTTTAGRTSISPRSPARRSRSSATTERRASSRRRIEPASRR